MTNYQEMLREMRESIDYKVEGAKLEFVTRVHDAMTAQGITQAELARRLGCSRAWVGQLLDTNANPTLGTMVKISEALGGSLDVKLRMPRKRQTSSDNVVPRPHSLAAKGAK